jgi:hypothetical protein
MTGIVTTTKKTAVKTAALGEFDDMTHIGFGTGTATPVETDTDLTTPILRVAFDETAVKNTGAGTYDFSGVLALTEGNGNDFAEVGTFDADAAGEMGMKLLLNSVVSKTVSLELSVGVRLNVNVS